MSASRTYAIIGCGMMGREHMRNLAIVPGTNLIAIVDPNEGSRTAARDLAEELGLAISVFTTVDGLFDETRPDAVIIASPNFTHYDVVRRVMKEQVAILLEKPMCSRLDDAMELAALQRDYPPLFWVGLEYRYMPPVTRFIEQVHDGRTGPVKMLSIREHRFPFLVKVGDWNRFNSNTGGTLVEKCCHFFDLMRHILRDEPVRIFASGGQDVNHLYERYDGNAPDILDNAFVLVDFQGGARAVLDLCMFAEGSEHQEHIHAVGPVGKLEVALPKGEVTWSPRDRSGPVVETIATPEAAMRAGDHHGATFYQLTAFQEALVSGLPPAISTIDGLRSVEMGVAAQESIATGRPVDLKFAG